MIFSPVDYISDEKLPHADKFFKQIQPKKVNREYLRKILGYSITGRTEARVFFIWYGFGSNGKCNNNIHNVIKNIYEN